MPYAIFYVDVATLHVSFAIGHAAYAIGHVHSDNLHTTDGSCRADAGIFQMVSRNVSLAVGHSWLVVADVLPLTDAC